MSTDDGEDSRIPGPPGAVPIGGGGGAGGQMFMMPYTRGDAADSVVDGVNPKASSSRGGGGDSKTPAPDGTENYRSEPGPIRRFNDVFTSLGSVQLEALGLDGHEIASATSKLRDEMYRSQFPLVQPRFSSKCADESCGAEYDKDFDFCPECARNEMINDGVARPPSDPEQIPEEYRDHPVRGPDPAEKKEARNLAESVNREGQSLRELMKSAEDHQSHLGVSTVIVRKNYAVAAGDSVGFDRGDMILEEPDEVIRGDPKRVVPVTDEDGRAGGWRWTCPVHREEALVDDSAHGEGDRCPECGAELREVRFVERKSPSRASYVSSGGSVEKYFFSDEVVTWARYFPRLHGLDGLSPVHHVWVKQAVLRWMDIYGAAFFDPDSESYPNKFMVVHTTNPDAWEKQFEKSEDAARDNPYAEKIMYNEYSPESSSAPEVQTIDLMQDDLIGQNQQIRDQYKKDIRTQFGVTDIFESELEDAGGLNNEGLQMEVTDREIASAMRDTVAGPLDELSKALGIDDWIYEFVPPQESDAEDLQQEIATGEKAAEAGLDARLEDGRAVVDDGDFEEPEGGDEGGLGALFSGDFGGLEDVVDHKAGDVEVDVYRIVAPDDGDYVHDLLGLAVDMPEHDVYCDWNRAAWSDGGLEEPHVSVYGNLSDLQTVADGSLEFVDSVGSAADFKSVRDEHGPGAGGGGAGGGGPGAGGAVASETDGTDRTPATARGERDDERGRRIGEYRDELNDEVYVVSETDRDGVVEVAYRDGTDSWLEARPTFEQRVGSGTWTEAGGGPGNAGGGEAGGLTTDEKLEQLRTLDEAFKHIVWADETAKADPFWDEDDTVPEFVMDAIESVTPTSIWPDFESIPGALPTSIADHVLDTLTQPQGWSLSSISENIREAFGVDPEDADLVARTETAKVLNEAREEGYRDAGALEPDDGEEDPRLFKWIGPSDHRTTDACRELKERTEGGVTFDELIELEKEITEEYFPSLDFRKHVIHPNERHTFVETFKLEHAGAAGPIEVEHKMDLSPALGTFEAVPAR